MPLTLPAIDERRFGDLRDEALARIPVHNPEWTNFNKSDPGVTLIELFAFLTESLLYRANQIPERNRRKFLTLLGLSLTPATAARGIVAFSNDRGPLATETLPAGFELRAGQIPFRLEQGLDVLPIEGHVFYKKEVKDPAPEIVAYYEQLYASFLDASPQTKPSLYETVPLQRGATLDLVDDTIDGCFWIALAARKGDTANASGDLKPILAQVRAAIGGKTLTLGVVPVLADATGTLGPAASVNADDVAPLRCDMPIGGELPEAQAERKPRYELLPVTGGDVLSSPGTVQIVLPPAERLILWSNLDPLEAGAGDFPPTIADSGLEGRVITWLRLSAPARPQAALQAASINAAMVTQRAHTVAERLPNGTGMPDQVAQLAHPGVLPASVQLFVLTSPNGVAERWTPIDDLADAGPEVPTWDPRLPPGTMPAATMDAHRFVVDAEAGTIRFGDGVQGARPPFGAQLTVDYDYAVGAAGNVNADAINAGPALPPGFTVSNPVRTWGGADAESIAEAEKQIPRYVQHRDRLVSAKDFVTITWRTPGVELGRVDVIPAASPKLGTIEPGDAPGAVTLMVIPRRDPEQPDAPRPDGLFIDAICKWLEPRRLVTTELFVRGPVYKKLWVSVGIDVAAGWSIAQVRQSVERALRAALSPLPDPSDESGSEALLPLLFDPPAKSGTGGWPLRKPVDALELNAIVARVDGVTRVRPVLLAVDGDSASRSSVSMEGLELPRIVGISVVVGDPLPLAELQGQTPGTGGPAAGGGGFVPVPIVPEEC